MEESIWAAKTELTFLLYTGFNATPTPNTDLLVLPLEGDRKPVMLPGTEFSQSQASFSRDMRWIAYTSNESGRNDIYIRPFDSSGSSGPSLGQVSKDGGTQPKWRADGKEIIFYGPNRSVMAVDVNGAGAAFKPEVPKQLFEAPLNYGWDVTSDGQRFLMGVAPGQQPTAEPITVVLNLAGGAETLVLGSAKRTYCRHSWIRRVTGPSAA